MLDFELDYLDDLSIEHVVEGTDRNAQTDQVEASKWWWSQTGIEQEGDKWCKWSDFCNGKWWSDQRTM